MKISGTVKRHLGRGKQLGFPTANLDVPDGIEDGIYAGLAVLPPSPGDGEGLGERSKLPSLIFIGASETFGETERHAEVYILDFSDDLYGQEIEVELKQKIRDNRKFESKEELIEQMKKDEQQARDFFNLSSPPPYPVRGKP